MGDIILEGVQSVVTREQSQLRGDRVCVDHMECLLEIRERGGRVRKSITGFMRKQ